MKNNYFIVLIIAAVVNLITVVYIIIQQQELKSLYKERIERERVLEDVKKEMQQNEKFRFYPCDSVILDTSKFWTELFEGFD